MQATSLLAPAVAVVQVWQAGPKESSHTSPTWTVAFCFLGDTSIRRCVRVTNLQAEQLSQGSLSRRVGKGDTLGLLASQCPGNHRQQVPLPGRGRPRCCVLYLQVSVCSPLSCPILGL